MKSIHVSRSLSWLFFVVLAWSFSTEATAIDPTVPTVSSTFPLNKAIKVATNANITATFDQAMDPATITTATFTLTQGATPVSGVVTYVGTTAIFNPTVDLAANQPYTATITTEAKNLASYPLADSVVWDFTTGATPAAGPPPVILGTAGDYAILAKTMITITGTGTILGDVGISPAALSDTTGFAPVLDLSNTFATSPFVTGKIYAADMASPTPSKLTTAISNMETAFTDAAGRPTPDFSEIYDGDITGKTLVPGLYKWGTGVLISAAGVTLSGGANDVWIFQIAQNLTVANDAMITLTGGAQPKNIFWQVSGYATLGTTSDFKGTILSQTHIVQQTGGRMTGRALAQSAVTLDANAIVTPPQSGSHSDWRIYH